MKKIFLILIFSYITIIASNFNPLVGFKSSVLVGLNSNETDIRANVVSVSKLWKFRFELPLFQETVYMSEQRVRFSLNGLVGVTNGGLFLLGVYNNYKPIIYVNATLFAISAIPNMHVNFELIENHLYLDGGHNLDIFLDDGSLAPVYSLSSGLEFKYSPLSVKGGFKSVIYDAGLYSGNILYFVGIILSLD